MRATRLSREVNVLVVPRCIRRGPAHDAVHVVHGIPDVLPQRDQVARGACSLLAPVGMERPSAGQGYAGRNAVRLRSASHGGGQQLTARHARHSPLGRRHTLAPEPLCAHTRTQRQVSGQRGGLCGTGVGGCRTRARNMERPTPLSPSGRRASRETARSAAPQEAQRCASSQANRPAPSPSRTAWADARRARASIAVVCCRSHAQAPDRHRPQAPDGQGSRQHSSSAVLVMCAQDCHE